jgi:hypothetical protein
MTHRALLIPVRACLMTAALLIVAVAWADPPKGSPEAKKDDTEKKIGADADEDDRRAVERLVGGIELEALVGGEWTAVKRIEKPLLYHGDPTRKHTRGSVWAWGMSGRPVALLELWNNGSNRTKWACGLCNTSGGKLRAKREGLPWWRENDSTIELKDIPGAPAPAAETALRQRQLKVLGQKFTGHQFWDPNNSRYELRRLERPLHTYRDEANALLDGGLYILANGTNPEVAVFVEARVQPGSKAAPVWQFTIGRMSHAEFHVEYDDKEVFSGPYGRPLSGADKPYWVSSIELPPDFEPKK